MWFFSLKGKKREVGGEWGREVEITSIVNRYMAH